MDVVHRLFEGRQIMAQHSVIFFCWSQEIFMRSRFCARDAKGLALFCLSRRANKKSRSKAEPAAARPGAQKFDLIIQFTSHRLRPDSYQDDGLAHSSKQILYLKYSSFSNT